jgi:Uma2 family endonuclease
MSTVTRTTAEELLVLPRGEHRYELVKGELIAMSPAGSEHGDIASEIGMLLRHYVKQHRLGRVFGAETGFLLERDPDTVLAPDAAFVRQERISEVGIPRGYFPGPPDLAVEIISPSETEQQADDKARAWLESGAKLVWNIRPLTRSIDVYRPGADVESLSAGDALTGEDVVPEFTCRVRALFPDA